MYMFLTMYWYSHVSYVAGEHIVRCAHETAFSDMLQNIMFHINKDLISTKYTPNFYIYLIEDNLSGINTYYYDFS